MELYGSSSFLFETHSRASFPFFSFLGRAIRVKNSRTLLYSTLLGQSSADRLM